jgi:hypothetical protein
VETQRFKKKNEFLEKKLLFQVAGDGRRSRRGLLGVDRAPQEAEDAQAHYNFVMERVAEADEGGCVKPRRLISGLARLAAEP